MIEFNRTGATQKCFDCARDLLSVKLGGVLAKSSVREFVVDVQFNTKLSVCNIIPKGDVLSAAPWKKAKPLEVYSNPKSVLVRKGWGNVNGQEFQKYYHEPWAIRFPNVRVGQIKINPWDQYFMPTPYMNICIWNQISDNLSGYLTPQIVDVLKFSLLAISAPRGTRIWQSSFAPHQLDDSKQLEWDFRDLVGSWNKVH